MGLGVLLDDNFAKVQSASTCQEKLKLLTNYRIISHINDGLHHLSEFVIDQTVREHIWNFYLFNCDNAFEEDRKNVGIKF
jgi:hypothetical protein